MTRQRRVLRGLSLLAGLLVFGDAAAQAAPAFVKPEDSRMWMTVGERRFAITMSDNPAAHAFAALLPLTLDMSDLNDNEKKARLPKALPANASRPGE